uniref:uncharacterized protein LOC120334185 n=1 Tax=Styela clava TaxID=7725 RepID=UPI00193A0122|nr:uncharacterized protein LOC120334185 [Styela clava]
MNSQTLSVGPIYAQKLLFSIKEMRKEKFACDFVIKAGKKAFNVHRNIISAASNYFKAMISSEMKERQQGYVEMKDAHPLILEICIDFIYTGHVELSESNIQDILHLSNFLQLDELTDLCFEYLQANLTCQCCLQTIELASLYNRQDVVVKAELFVVDNLEKVISNENFTSIVFKDLSYYLEASKSPYNTKWKAVTTWHDDKEGKVDKTLFTLMELLKIKDFPFDFVLGTIWKEPLLRRSVSSTSLVFGRLFSDVEEIIENLTIDNFLILKSWANNQNIVITENMRTVMNEFMAEYFEQLLYKNEFFQLDEKEIFFLFQSRNTKYSPELVKWNAALKWTKHIDSRKMCFPGLLKLINWHEFSPNFIRQIVRYETLVKESRESETILLDAIYSRPEVNETGHPQIACLESETGEVRAFDTKWETWHLLPNVSKGYPMHIVNVNDKLYVVSGTDLFVLEDNRTWKKTTVDEYRRNMAKNRIISGENLYGM